MLFQNTYRSYESPKYYGLKIYKNQIDLLINQTIVVCVNTATVLIYLMQLLMMKMKFKYTRHLLLS